MKCLIAKVKNGGRSAVTYRRILSDVDIYVMPDDLSNALDYSPDTLHEDNEWYQISGFSEKPFCLQLLKNDFSSVNYDNLGRQEIDKIGFLCSLQDDIFFSKMSAEQVSSPKESFIWVIIIILMKAVKALILTISLMPSM